MLFRTEIEIPRGARPIKHDDKIVMLGSCFTDSIGEKLVQRGFDVIHNPMGPLYNPASLKNFIERACEGPSYTAADLTVDNEGTFHCLDFPLRYSNPEGKTLLNDINLLMLANGLEISNASTVIITLGTARTFIHDGIIVGNCHKLPSNLFTEHFLDYEEALLALRQIIDLLEGKRVIFTVSPIRHTGYGLHANQLSKATLLLAIDTVCRESDNVEYFPAYEIMLDDLRDYRFYAADMKHPSDVAVDYIFDKFADTYFDKATRARAEACYKEHLRGAHRQNIQS